MHLVEHWTRDVPEMLSAERTPQSRDEAERLVIASQQMLDESLGDLEEAIARARAARARVALHVAEARRLGSANPGEFAGWRGLREIL